MKVLVLGSGGMLGHITTLYLVGRGYDVTDISKTKKCRPETILLDVTQTDFFEKFLRENKFDYVINCVALLVKESLRHKSMAILLNSYFPHLLNEFYDGTDTRILHVSTAGVYRGDKAPYQETDRQDAQIFYGRTKVLGEIENENVLTVRSDFYGPDLKENGSGLFHWGMTSRGEVCGYQNVYFNGVSSLEFAKFVEMAIEGAYSGVYNLHAKDTISKGAFIKQVKDIFNITKLTVNDTMAEAEDHTLATMRKDISYTHTGFTEQLLELRKWMQQHKSLYTHYDRREEQ